MANPISQRDNGDGTVSVQFDDGSERLMKAGVANAVPVAVVPPPAPPPPQDAGWGQSAPAAQAAPTPPQAPADLYTGATQYVPPPDVPQKPTVSGGGKLQHANVEALIAKLPLEQQAAARAQAQANAQIQEQAQGVSAPQGPPPDYAMAIPRGSPGGGAARAVPAQFVDAGGVRTIYSPDAQRAHDASIEMQARAGEQYANRIGDLMQSEGEAANYLRQDIAIQNLKQQELRQRQDVDMATASDDIRKTAADIASTKIDPNRVWAEKSTLGKISAAFGIALAAVGGAMARQGGNVALQIINDQIDRDVNAQVANLNNKRASLADKNSLYSQMLNRYGNADAALAATKASLFEAAKLKADEFAAQQKNIQGDKGFADMTAGLMEQQAKWLAETQGVIKQSYAPAHVVGGGGGGDSPINMIARAAAKASGGDPVKAAAMAHDLAAAQGLKEGMSNEAARRASASVAIVTGQSSQDAETLHKAEIGARGKAYEEGLTTKAKAQAEGPKLDKDAQSKIAAFQAAQQDLIKMKAAKGGFGDSAVRMYSSIAGVKPQSSLDYEAARGAYEAHLRQAYGGRQPPESLLPKAELGGAGDVPQAILGGSRFAALQKQLEADMARVQGMEVRGGAAPRGKPSDIQEEDNPGGEH